MRFAGFIGLVTLSLTSASLSATPVYSVTDIGSLGGSVTALGINDNGDIVGTSQLTPDGSSPLHAFLYRHASRSMVDLGTPGGSSSEAFAINDSGTISGEVYAPDPQTGTSWAPVVWLASGGSQSLKGPYPNGVGLYVSPNGISNTNPVMDNICMMGEATRNRAAPSTQSSAPPSARKNNAANIPANSTAMPCA